MSGRADATARDAPSSCSPMPSVAQEKVAAKPPETARIPGEPGVSRSHSGDSGGEASWMLPTPEAVRRCDLGAGCHGGDGASGCGTALGGASGNGSGLPPTALPSAARSDAALSCSRASEREGDEPRRDRGEAPPPPSPLLPPPLLGGRSALACAGSACGRGEVSESGELPRGLPAPARALWACSVGACALRAGALLAKFSALGAAGDGSGSGRRTRPPSRLRGGVCLKCESSAWRPHPPLSS